MAGQRPKGLKLLKAALATRKSATMLAFGFSSGLPFALLIGTLNAWLGDAKVNLATIGVRSWIGLGYAFKFLWSPLVDRVRIPVLGRRTSWIVLCQVGLIIAFIGLGATDPATNIGWFAIFAVIGAFSSATQDIAVDAWRIDVADEKTTVELLSAVYQFGYRTASIVGGAFALFLAARIPWGTVYWVMAALVVGVMIIAMTAPDTERPPKNVIEEGLEQPGAISAQVRLAALAIVGDGFGVIQLATLRQPDVEHAVARRDQGHVLAVGRKPRLRLFGISEQRRARDQRHSRRRLGGGNDRKDERGREYAERDRPGRDLVHGCSSRG